MRGYCMFNNSDCWPILHWTSGFCHQRDICHQCLSLSTSPHVHLTRSCSGAPCASHILTADVLIPSTAAQTLLLAAFPCSIAFSRCVQPRACPGLCIMQWDGRQRFLWIVNSLSQQDLKVNRHYSGWCFGRRCEITDCESKHFTWRVDWNTKYSQIVRLSIH